MDRFSIWLGTIGYSTRFDKKGNYCLYSDVKKLEKQNTEMLEVITVLLETHTPDQVCKGCETPPYCPCGEIERAQEIHKIAKRIIDKMENKE